MGFRVAVHPDDTVRYVRDHSGFPVSGPLEDVRKIRQSGGIRVRKIRHELPELPNKAAN